ncbi:MAG TPA: TetR/AcrR family transcriptional regulator [Acidimicrobiales bacterium]|nr:TetR/AcrR family transcriptional regulator [Acidimicrobiales bacterium]
MTQGPVTDGGLTEVDLAAEIERHRRGQVPAELRRSHALLAATALFLAHGYRATSMDDLATRCGISKPVLYDLVGSKEQLFTDVMARAADELADRVATAVDDEVDLTGKMEAGALAFFEFIEERRDAWHTLLAPGAAPLGTEMDHLRARQVRQVARLLTTSANPAGDPIDSIEAEMVAHAITGASEALAAWWQLDCAAAGTTSGSRPSAESLASWVTTLLTPGLRALAAADRPHPR